MADGGKKFPYLLSKFQTKSRVNTSIVSLIQTTAVAAFKLRGASKSFFGPNNLKRKVCYGGDESDRITETDCL